MRGRREKTVWMAVLVGLLGLIVGFFLGEFFVYLAENIEFLSFMSVLGYHLPLGPVNIAPDLLFASFSLGFTINLSILGVVAAIVLLVIYYRRR